MRCPGRSGGAAETGAVCRVRVIFFDFGGVLAREGFRNGLMTIGRENGLDPETFTRTAVDLVYSTGYVLGRSTEEEYWNALREATGIEGGAREWRSLILGRFETRPGMMALVERLKARGMRLAILSDQTDWLDELDRRHHFYRHFERVFNSFYLEKSKRDPSLFDDVVASMDVPAEEALFVDDNPGNVVRARARGLNAILFVREDQFRRELEAYCPGLRPGGWEAGRSPCP